MGQRFVACDREQSFLMPPDVREWLPEGHLAWFVLDAVDEMDLEAFYAAYRRDGRSRPAYDPAMMVALLLYAFAFTFVPSTAMTPTFASPLRAQSVSTSPNRPAIASW